MATVVNFDVISWIVIYEGEKFTAHVSSFLFPVK